MTRRTICRSTSNIRAASWKRRWTGSTRRRCVHSPCFRPRNTGTGGAERAVAGISPYLEGRQSLPDREGRERDSISGLSPLRNRGTGSAERMAAGIPGLIASQNELPGGSGKRSAPIPLHDPVFFAAEQGCRRRGTDSRGNFSVTTPFCSSIAYCEPPGMKRRQSRFII